MNHINKLVLKIVILVFPLLSGSVISAQEPAGSAVRTSLNISASAIVVGPDIDLETISDIQIVEARRQQDGSSDIYINPVFDPEAGKMRARGQPGAQIRLSYLQEMIVARREGTGSLMFRFEVSGHPGDNQNESELLDIIERLVRFSDEGFFYFWIGGRVDLSQALPGTYEADFTIEIEYI